MDKGKRKRKSPPPSPVSATSLTKRAAASLNAPKSASASSKTKNAAASLNAPKSVSVTSLNKRAATSINAPKSASASSKTKNVAASLNAPKSASASSKTKNVAIENVKGKDPNSDDDPPEEIFQKPFKKFKGPDLSYAKNPYQCPDMDDAYEWTSKDRKNYTKWLGFEARRRFLTRDEQAYLQTWGANQATGRKTNF